MDAFFSWAKKNPLLFGVLLSGSYGLIMRILIYSDLLREFIKNDFFGVASVGFLFGIPFVMGYLTLAGYTERQPQERLQWSDLGWAIVLPWFTTLASFVVILLLGFELFICLLMAAPLFFAMASLGGLLALFVAHRGGNYQRVLAGLVALPMMGSAFESQVSQPPVSVHTVHNTIQIAAPVERVWQAIERVPEIQESEQSPSWLHDLGFPRPLEATLSRPGVGGVRHASFEDQILFVETVTHWDPPRKLSFEIVPELDQSASPVVNANILGGRYFDILRGTYELEPLSGGQTLLHLTSQQRVSTFYNAYSSLWTRWIMSELQGYILKVIQQRCEQPAAPALTEPLNSAGP